MPADNDKTHERKLAAVLAADVAGYSKLMADDELATVAALKQARAVFRDRIAAHSGRLIDTAGDSVLAEFRSVAEAVDCAVEVQERLATDNAPVPEHRKMHFRIGINLGDIIEEDDGTIYGDGVNVAARLEGLAAPGGVMISDFARQAVEGKLDVGMADAGEHEVKNIAKPVRAWRVVVAGEEAPRPPAKILRRPKVVAGLVAGLAIMFGLGVWGLTIRIEAPQMVKADGSPTNDPVLAVASGPSIAVLPFENLSGDPEQDFFADGLTEELITGLSRFRELRVIARHSTMEYKHRGVDVRQVGRDLDVRYVVEGSVRRSADVVRITAQLLSSADGGHLWGESYERPLSAENLFAVQDEITAQVVAMIAGGYGVLSRIDSAGALDKPTMSLTAYECVLYAYVYLEIQSEEMHADNRACLEKAVELDPTYVDAWAWLAGRYGEEHIYGFNTQPNAMQRALETARHAVKLDGTNQTARYVLAWLVFFERNLELFRVEADLAISLNPNNSLVLADLGLLIAYSGDWDKGLALVNKAIFINPHHPGFYHFLFAYNQYRLQNYDAALVSASRIATPDLHYNHVILGAVYGQLGRLDEARETVARLNALYPNYATNVRGDMEAWFYASPEMIEQIIDGLEKAGLFDEPEAPSRPVIAVLPFDNMSGDPEQEYFADGITEDIITRLAQFPDILVLGRNTTFQFKGQAVDIKTIAEKLGADYVVEGSIRRGGDTVRVTAQLLEGEDGTHLWAETYDRALDPANLFAVQDEITVKIASRIGDPYGEVNRAEYRGSDSKPPKYLSSYDCILRYFEYLRIITEDRHRVARDCLESVLEVEPTYGEALAYLADLYLDEVGLGDLSPKSTLI